MSDMMLRPLTKIVIQQITGGRNKQLTFNYVNKFKATNFWNNLTNTCKITLPKNVFAVDAEGNKIPLGGQSASVWLSTLFQPGDYITVDYGYIRRTQEGSESIFMNRVFTGFIAKVGARVPVELDCEDNMWLLKQIPCVAQTWPKTKTVEDLLKHLLNGATSNGRPITVNALTSTTIGDLSSDAESGTVSATSKAISSTAPLINPQSPLANFGANPYILPTATQGVFLNQPALPSEPVNNYNLYVNPNSLLNTGGVNDLILNGQSANALNTISTLYDNIVGSADKKIPIQTVGDFIIGAGESVAAVLMRLKHDYHLEAYFSSGAPFNESGQAKNPGCELRIGSWIYIDPPTTQPVYQFTFEKNIISDQLSYQDKQWVKMSAICESYNSVSANNGKNRMGVSKTKKECLQVLVYSTPDTIKTGKFAFLKKVKNVPFPPNVDGERRTFYFPDVKTSTQLAELGSAMLKKYYYTGFKGKFTTFAIPPVSIGDHIQLVSRKLPDRNGQYVVKGVEYEGGVSGHRQVVEVDFKLSEANVNVVRL